MTLLRLFVSVLKQPLLFILICGLVVLFASCEDDRDAIEKTVEGFFESISSKDLDALQEYFPTFATLDAAEQAAYVTVFSSFDKCEVTDITIDDANAVAVVTATSSTGALMLHLPLTYHEKRWIVTERTSMRVEMGTVPAE